MTLHRGTDLDSLTIGELAKELEMSKSGLFAHFSARKKSYRLLPSTRREIVFWLRHSIEPRVNLPGFAALRLPENYIQYLTIACFQGLLFSAAAAEYDDRPGRRARPHCSQYAQWRSSGEQAIVAQTNGELLPDVDPSNWSSN